MPPVKRPKNEALTGRAAPAPRPNVRETPTGKTMETEPGAPLVLEPERWFDSIGLAPFLGARKVKRREVEVVNPKTAKGGTSPIDRLLGRD